MGLLDGAPPQGGLLGGALANREAWNQSGNNPAAGLLGQYVDWQKNRDFQAELSNPGFWTNMAASFAAPIRAYHGSPNGNITAFRPSDRGPLGNGVYLSPVEMIAERYKPPGGRMYEADIHGDIFNGLGARGADPGVSPAQQWRDQMGRLVNAAEPEMRDKVAQLAGRYNYGDGYPLYYDLANAYRSEERAQGLFQRAGFDGVSGRVDGPEISVFNPSTIEILRKYGIMAPLVGAGAAAGTGAGQ